MTAAAWAGLPDHVGWGAVALLLVAALAAGWVDAVVGGGGLVQLPALLIALGPATAVVHSLATNKIASICGTSTSAVTYYRRVHPDLRTALPMAAAALVGALGARASRWCCRRPRSVPSSSSRSQRCWSTPCADRAWAR